MTVNYLMKCPMCGKITRMRTPAGYVENAPVHIHCSNCKTLMTGLFVSDNKNSRAYFAPTNCKTSQKDFFEFNYYGESSGELITHKICTRDDNMSTIMPTISPAMLAITSIDDNVFEIYIDYVCHISELKEKWDFRSMLYELFLNGEYDLIREKYSDDAAKWRIDLSDDYGIQSFVHMEYLYDFGRIFGVKDFEDTIINLNYEISHLDQHKLDDYLTLLAQENRLNLIQKKMFSIMKDYINIAHYVMPALSTKFYRDTHAIDKEHYGLSTCTFNDIKNFYQDTFEALASQCDIIKCLDNIKNRSGYNDFGTKMDLYKFNNNTKNGNRVKELNREETFSEFFALDSSSNELRNAIGHNDFTYDGISQTITYIPNKLQPNDIKSAFLMDIAISCIDMMKSSIVLELIAYELYRVMNKNNYDTLVLHPIFYKRTNGNNHCPCGSGKKYKKCCKTVVNNYNKLKIKDFCLPHKAATRFNI